MERTAGQPWAKSQLWSDPPEQGSSDKKEQQEEKNVSGQSLYTVYLKEEIRIELGVLAGSTNTSKETIERLEELETKYTPYTALVVDDTWSLANSPRRATQ